MGKRGLEDASSYSLSVVPVKEESVKKTILLLLIAALMLTMTACRRRIVGRDPPAVGLKGQ